LHIIVLHDETKYNNGMTAATTPRTCAYPGCDQPTAAPENARGAKPKYCDDPDHNPLSAHRERRRRQAEANGQRAEETGGQPVTLGITRAAELITALEKITRQHADTLTRAMTELREVGDIESAEAEVYAARTSADQRVATAEAHLAEEIQRRRDAEAERDAAQADREQADDAATQAVARMEELERELAELRTATEREVRGIRDGAAAEIRQAREGADRDISAARAAAARQVAEAKARAEQAEHDTARARQAEAAAVTRADHAQAAATDETARIRADHQHALDQLTVATSARVAALEETRDALRVRAERAETDLDTARTENQRLAEQLAQAVNESADDPEADNAPTPRTRAATRVKRASATRKPRLES
jgi:colicin import membrane protein